MSRPVQVSTLSHRIHWGNWWRWPARVEQCASCGVVTACWWIDVRRVGQLNVQWRCIGCLPHLITTHGRHWHDPVNPFAPTVLTTEQVAALIKER